VSTSKEIKLIRQWLARRRTKKPTTVAWKWHKEIDRCWPAALCRSIREGERNRRMALGTARLLPASGQHLWRAGAERGYRGCAGAA
jgi:hypothetical protein